MAIPFIVAAAVTGAYGLKKHLDASENNDKAKQMLDYAKGEYERAKGDMDSWQETLKNDLSDLGELKCCISAQELAEFVKLYGMFKNVHFQGEASSDLPKLADGDFDENYREMQVATADMGISAGEGFGSLGAGALAGIAAYGGVSMFAAASTGTAISALSGAAATNATLAWLGGGSLAAGGLGIAGGTAVLGGIVLAPILAVSGILSSSKSVENLAKAQAQHGEIMNAVEQMKTVVAFCKELDFLACDYKDFFAWFRDILSDSLEDFAHIADRYSSARERDGKINFMELDMREKRVIQVNRLLVQLLWISMKTPLLVGDNKLNPEASDKLDGFADTANGLLE